MVHFSIYINLRLFHQFKTILYEIIVWWKMFEGIQKILLEEIIKIKGTYMLKYLKPLLTAASYKKC